MLILQINKDSRVNLVDLKSNSNQLALKLVELSFTFLVATSLTLETMSINHRRPNGYWITKYRHTLFEYYDFKARLEEKAAKASPQEQNLVTIVYNDEKEITVDRDALAKSCFYFERLLAGPYKESTQSKINVYIERNFSYEAFESIINYAVDKQFLRDASKFKLHLEMIQLASYLMYDELIEVIESHFKDILKLKNLEILHTLAISLNLPKLKEACLNAEHTLDTRVTNLQRTVGCPFHRYDHHHYASCSYLKKAPIEVYNDYPDNPGPIVEEEEMWGEEDKEKEIADSVSKVVDKYNNITNL